MDKEELYQKFLIENLTIDECAEFFNVNRNKIRTECKKYGFKKNTELQKQNRERIVKAKYGVINVSQLSEVKEKKAHNPKIHGKEAIQKRTQTNRLKYNGRGCNYDKISEEVFKKYGVYNISSLYSIKKLKSNNPNFDIYNNKELLEKYIKEKNIINSLDLSKHLQLSPSQLGKKLKEFDLRKQLKADSSFFEIQIERFLKGLNITYIKDEREKIKPLQLDFYIPDYNLALELNGIYWHSDLFKKEKYHFYKSQKCEEQGIRLIHIFEYEDLDKIKLFLINIFNEKRKIFARKCELRTISKEEKSIFLNNNHLQGNDHSSIEYGLFYNNELVQVITFCKPRFNKKYDWELSRLATKIGYLVIGGASKLLKTRPQGSLISYQNYSKFNGNVYEKLGFTFLGYSRPNYVWCKPGEIKTRYQCQFKNEDKIMKEQGYLKVYDSGNKIWGIN